MSIVSRCNYSERPRRWRRASGASVALAALALGCGGEGTSELYSGVGQSTASAGSSPELVLTSPPDAGSADADRRLDPGAGPHRGDDAPQRIVEIGTLTNSAPPSECVAGLPTRLPDCSLDDTTPRGLDCDGDGVLDHRIYGCDLSTAERPALFGGDFDCEPSDPGLRYWVWRDADGDGAGSGPPLCAGPEVPEGYVRVSDSPNYDCDDAIAAVHPGAAEVWGDGFDADCSNSDFPACGRFEQGSVPDRVLATDGCSDGPDLYLSSIAACGDRCLDFGSAFGFVGNSGTAPAAGPIRIQYRDDRGQSGQIEVSPEGLAPGAGTALFEVPFSLIGRLEIWVVASDCNPDDDRFVLELPGDPDAICPI
ncbi:MAG TPA: hypothetical protein VMG12_32335 [Polyangiaceae bacterium]|nr:hypothetical protein [Polyangiaceae bacterium]